MCEWCLQDVALSYGEIIRVGGDPQELAPIPDLFVQEVPSIVAYRYLKNSGRLSKLLPLTRYCWAFKSLFEPSFRLSDTEHRDYVHDIVMEFSHFITTVEAELSESLLTLAQKFSTEIGSFITDEYDSEVHERYIAVVEEFYEWSKLDYDSAMAFSRNYIGPGMAVGNTKFECVFPMVFLISLVLARHQQQAVRITKATRFEWDESDWAVMFWLRRCVAGFSHFQTA